MNAPTVQDDAPDNRKGTGFTNLQKYLGANSGNNLDQYIGNQISGEAQNYNNDLNSAQSNFQSDIDKQNQAVSGSQSDIDNTLSGFSTPSNGTTGQTGTSGSTAGSLPAGTSSAAPTITDQYNQAYQKYAPTDQQVSNFQNYMHPTYNGPQGMGNVDQLRASAQNLNSIGSSSDPQGLLSRYLGGTNPYTSGQQNFDTMFLGNANNIKQNLNQLSSINPNSVDSMAQGDQAAIQGVQNQQKSVADNLRSRLGLDQTGQFNNSGIIQDQLSGIDKNVKAKQDSIQSAKDQLAAANGVKNFSQLSPQLAQMYGLSSGDFSQYAPTGNYSGGGTTKNNIGYGNDAYVSAGQLYNLNPNTYTSYVDPATINRQNVATPDDAARLAALSKLAGIQQNFVDPTNDTLGSMINTSPYNFNKQGFLNDITKSKGDYNNSLHAAEGAYLNTAPQSVIDGQGHVHGGADPAQEEKIMQQIKAQYGLT